MNTIKNAQVKKCRRKKQQETCKTYTIGKAKFKTSMVGETCWLKRHPEKRNRSDRNQHAQKIPAPNRPPPLLHCGCMSGPGGNKDNGRMSGSSQSPLGRRVRASVRNVWKSWAAGRRSARGQVKPRNTSIAPGRSLAKKIHSVFNATEGKWAKHGHVLCLAKNTGQLREKG